MGIFMPDGDGGQMLDLVGARVELIGARALHNEGAKRLALAEIQTAALLDIAESLRPLALDALIAMGGPPEPEPDPEPSDDFVVVGDYGRVLGDPGAPKIEGLVKRIGVDQGEHYAVIATDRGEVRAWLSIVERIPEPDVEPEPEPHDVADGYADEIDDDFEGDAASALELLQRNEAERKKSGKKKKGK